MNHKFPLVLVVLLHTLEVRKQEFVFENINNLCILASIERSAAYLAFKEPELEFLFRETDTQGIYSFLNPIDPYYPYYRFRLQEIKEGESKYTLVWLNIGFQFFNFLTIAIYQERPQINNYREPVKIAPKEPGPDEISEHTSATLAYDL